ncbi:MAG: hypothetical protein AB7T27_02050 [Kiritimatiellia bacterium]
MNLRKDQLGLIIGASLLAIVMAVAAFVLFKVWRGYSSVNADFERQATRFQQMQQRDPYPSDENVARVAENAALLQQRRDGLMDSLLKNQIEPQSMEKAQFPPMLGEVMRKLRKSAEDSKVLLPASFTMGFDRYLLQGELPQSTNDISRLVIQLKEAEKVLGMVFAVGLGEVISFNRELFEGTAAQASSEEMDPRLARRARRSVRAVEEPVEGAEVIPLKKQSDLYTSEHFSMEVKGREEAVWRLLNEMARSDIKIVVTCVTLSSEQPDIKKTVEAIKMASKTAADMAVKGSQSQVPGAAPRMTAPAAGAMAPVIVPSAEERVVSGREPVTAKIEFDVYRFTKPAAIQETAE